MNTARLSIILILCQILQDSYSISIVDKLKRIKTKGVAIYKQKYGKNSFWNYLGYDPSEYPGTNQKLKEINRNRWDEYYNCLRRQRDNLGPHGSVIPEAVMAFDGESITLECKICLSPSETNEVDSVQWEYAHLTSKFLEPLELTEITVVSPDDKTLRMYNLGQENSGQYVCKLGNQLTAPYFLTVTNESEPIRLVHSRRPPYKLELQKISADIVLATVWGPWSPCSTCRTVGKTYKSGYCYIILVTDVHEDLTNRTENSTVPLINKKPPKIPNTDIEMLKIFKYGIPCRSHILTKQTTANPAIHNRPSEIMEKYCKVNSPDAKIFVVKDKNGHIIEKVNNSAGVYSVVQGIPAGAPPVQQVLRYEPTDTEITIKCPGKLNSDIPIRWQINGKNILPELITQESKGRVFITITNKIRIKRTKRTDSNIYSCWQDEELTGSVRLVVERRIKLDFDHHVMLIGIVLILSTFLFIFFKAFTGRKLVNE